MLERRPSSAALALVAVMAVAGGTALIGSPYAPRFDEEPTPTGRKADRLLPADKPVPTDCRGQVAIGRMRKEVLTAGYKGNESKAPKVDEAMPFPEGDLEGLKQSFDHHTCAVEYDIRNAAIQDNTVVVCDSEMTIRDFNKEHKIEGIVYDYPTYGQSNSKIQIELFNELQRARNLECPEKVVPAPTPRITTVKKVS